jgi:hypothetical protein
MKYRNIIILFFVLSLLSCSDRSNYNKKKSPPSYQDTLDVDALISSFEPSHIETFYFDSNGNHKRSISAGDTFNIEFIYKGVFQKLNRNHIITVSAFSEDLTVMKNDKKGSFVVYIPSNFNSDMIEFDIGIISDSIIFKELGNFEVEYFDEIGLCRRGLSLN